MHSLNWGAESLQVIENEYNAIETGVTYVWQTGEAS